MKGLPDMAFLAVGPVTERHPLTLAPKPDIGALTGRKGC